MKILMVDKYYFVKGGAERYMFELSKVLQANGHEIIPFSMRHPDNFETEYEPFFPSNIEYNGHAIAGKLATLFKASGRMIYSLEARQQMERLIEATRPDLAHLHMIDHQLSPSILHALKKYDIPVIQTVHQYKLVCPNYRLYNPSTGKVCEKCLGGNLLHPIAEGCHKDSTVASLLIAVESTLHRLTRIYEKHIDLFHVPSHFMGRKFKEAGVGEGKVRHLFYAINMADFTPHFCAGNYLLYFGRLADEKGILTLLEAVKSYAAAPLYIVGDGPQRPKLEAFVSENHLDNVEFLGLKSGQELEGLVKNARVVIVPSEWHDNSPLVIYESFAYGKPVICSKMGGMPELVDHEQNGYHFAAGAVDELSACMAKLWENPQLAVRFGKAARAKAEREFDPEVHYNKMYDWYQELSKRTPVLAEN
ncbi:MAG: glycosyltransferase family 4 protein [bacterium]